MTVADEAALLQMRGSLADRRRRVASVAGPAAEGPQATIEALQKLAGAVPAPSRKARSTPHLNAPAGAESH